jgi:hypothetical protein
VGRDHLDVAGVERLVVRADVVEVRAGHGIRGMRGSDPIDKVLGQTAAYEGV